VAATAAATIAPAVRAPLLLLQGSADLIAPAAATAEFFEAVGSSKKTLHVLPGARHWPLHDAGAADVLAVIAAWATDVLGAM